MSDTISRSLKAKFIYNPHAGKKRKVTFASQKVTLEDIKKLLEQYQIPVDYYPTKYPGHATELAREAIKQRYGMVIVAGGDGTVGETANGLVGSKMPLGILPLGTFMNIPRMLSIPTDNIELAVAMLKIKRTRKIDIGSLNKIGGEKLDKPHYFLEECGVGLEAIFHQYFLDIENGDVLSILKLLRKFIKFYSFPLKVKVDDDVKEVEATLVAISNGPYAGAALELAPRAKLNDHRLTVSIFKMNKLELTTHFLRMLFNKKQKREKIQTLKAQKVIITSNAKRPIHADARVYGETPIEVKIIPNALTIVTGFPTKEDTALITRTTLDP